MKKSKVKKEGTGESSPFDYGTFEKEAIDRLKEGAGLVGSGMFRKVCQSECALF